MTIDDRVKDCKDEVIGKGCHSCTYITFDAIIRDDDRLLVPELHPSNFPMEPVYVYCLKSIMKKITSTTHGVVGIYDNENGYHIIVDLYKSHIIIKANSNEDSCETISKMKSKMDKIASQYHNHEIDFKQFLITDSYNPCCEIKANTTKNSHKIKSLYAK